MASEIAEEMFRRINMSYAAKKVIEQAKEFAECLEGGVPREECLRRVYMGIYKFFVEGLKPFPTPYDTGSVEVRQKIFETPGNAMTFGKHVVSAFKETGIKLKDDETFACLVYVTKRPTHVSQVITPTTGEVYCIMEPGIMKQVMEVMEQGKIKY